MATVNMSRWVGNLDGAKEPLIIKGLFQAGATAAIEAGELLEFTGDTNTAWVPLDSDFDMDSNVAIAAESIKSGDLAGYYQIYCPRPGDMWEFDLATAAGTAYGTALTYSSSDVVTTGGTYPIGYAVGQQHYPQYQNHMSDGEPSDSGTSIRTQATVIMTIKAACSIYSALVV